MPSSWKSPSLPQNSWNSPPTLCLWNYQAHKVKVTQLCPTLWESVDYWILQARILEWVAVHFSRGSSQPRDRTQVSCISGGLFTSWATREAWEYHPDSSVGKESTCNAGDPGSIPGSGRSTGAHKNYLNVLGPLSSVHGECLPGPLLP